MEVEEEALQVMITSSHLHPSSTSDCAGYPIHPASTSPGGGAIRTRGSGERRWENSPYGSDRNYYSSSLVSTYLSPPPESRWKIIQIWAESGDQICFQVASNALRLGALPKACGRPASWRQRAGEPCPGFEAPRV